MTRTRISSSFRACCMAQTMWAHSSDRLVGDSYQMLPGYFINNTFAGLLVGLLQQSRKRCSSQSTPYQCMQRVHVYLSYCDGEDLTILPVQQRNSSYFSDLRLILVRWGPDIYRWSGFYAGSEGSTELFEPKSTYCAEQSLMTGPFGLTFTWWGCCGLCFWHKPTELAHSFLFRSCACFCLYGPFNCISFHRFSRQLCAFSLCSSGLISALLVLSTVYLFAKVSFSPDVTL